MPQRQKRVMNVILVVVVVVVWRDRLPGLTYGAWLRSFRIYRLGSSGGSFRRSISKLGGPFIKQKMARVSSYTNPASLSRRR